MLIKLGKGKAPDLEVDGPKSSNPSSDTDLPGDLGSLPPSSVKWDSTATLMSCSGARQLVGGGHGQEGALVGDPGSLTQAAAVARILD